MYYIMTFHDMVQLMMYSLVPCHGAHKISTDLQTYRPVQASTYTYINVQTCTGQYVHVHTGTYAYMLFLTLLKKCNQVVYTVYTTVVHGISKGHFLYTWYIALYPKSDLDNVLYH